MLDDIRAALARHLPGHDGVPVVPLGSGLDNVAFEAGGLVLRRSTAADPLAAARREAALLAAVAAVSSLPVPEPVFVDEPTAILAYRKVPGAPLHLNPVADPGALAGPLAAFLSGLHLSPDDDGGSSLAAMAGPDDAEPAEWLAGAAESYGAAAIAIDAAGRRRVEAFLAAAPPPGPRRLAFCHNDLGAEHLLVDGAAITGVIDWTDAAVADPAVDLGRLHRDLGPDVAGRIAAAYTGDPDAVDPGRVLFYARCTLLEDIAFGVTTGTTEYARLGLAHLDRTFA